MGRYRYRYVSILDEISPPRGEAFLTFCILCGLWDKNFSFVYEFAVLLNCLRLCCSCNDQRMALLALKSMGSIFWESKAMTSLCAKYRTRIDLKNRYRFKLVGFLNRAM